MTAWLAVIFCGLRRSLLGPKEINLVEDLRERLASAFGQKQPVDEVFVRLL